MSVVPRSYGTDGARIIRGTIICRRSACTVKKFMFIQKIAFENLRQWSGTLPDTEKRKIQFVILINIAKRFSIFL